MALRSVRRSFWSIHRGHFTTHDASLDAEAEMYAQWNRIISLDFKALGFTGIALALEEGEQLGRMHIQGYAEHSQMRFPTLAKKIGATATAFSVVRESKSSYEYCTGTGVHLEKPALARFEFGVFKLHGDTQKADLRLLTELIMQGATATQLLKEYPYAWCVHRARLIPFIGDLEQLEKRGRLDITRPPRY